MAGYVTSSLLDAEESLERLIEVLLRRHDVIRPIVFTHDLRALSAVKAYMELLEIPAGRVEFQMMHGVSEEFAQLFCEDSCRVRVLAPLGPVFRFCPTGPRLS